MLHICVFGHLVWMSLKNVKCTFRQIGCDTKWMKDIREKSIIQRQHLVNDSKRSQCCILHISNKLTKVYKRWASMCVYVQKSLYYLRMHVSFCCCFFSFYLRWLFYSNHFACLLYQIRHTAKSKATSTTHR